MCKTKHTHIIVWHLRARHEFRFLFTKQLTNENNKIIIRKVSPKGFAEFRKRPLSPKFYSYFEHLKRLGLAGVCLTSDCSNATAKLA